MRFFVLYLLLIGAAVFVYSPRDIEAIPANLRDIPRLHGGWVVASEGYFQADVLEVLRPADYIYRSYSDGRQRVNLYVGYHTESSIHSPRHCLPGAGWIRESEEETPYGVKAVYRNGEQRQTFVYWYQVGGEVMTSEFRLKLAEVVGSLRGQRGAAFVRISGERAEEFAAAYSRQIAAALDSGGGMM